MRTVKNVDPGMAERLVKIALDCVHREYPNKASHVLNSDSDVAAPALRCTGRRAQESRDKRAVYATIDHFGVNWGRS